MKFNEITPGLFRATRRGINLYLWVGAEQSVLFDTGEPSFADAVTRALGSFPPVRSIVLTHCHFDHAGSAAELAQTFGADVYAHPLDGDLLAKGRWRRPSQPSPTLLGRVLTKLVASRYPDTLTPIPAIKPISEETELPWPGIRAINLPGHSAGQLGFSVGLSSGRRAWIVGDVAMNAGGMREPILYEDRPLGPASIRKLADAITPGDVLCFGHGKPRTVDRGLRCALANLARD